VLTDGSRKPHRSTQVPSRRTILYAFAGPLDLTVLTSADQGLNFYDATLRYPFRIHAMLSIRLLEGLTERDKKSILAEGRTNKYAKNTELCAEGKEASHLFLMTKGQAKYYRLMKDGRQVIFYWLQPGDTLGLATMLANPLPYLGSAEAVSDCEVSSWPHATMQRFARQYPVLSVNALRIVLLYLSSGADRHSAMISDTAKERLARTLAELGSRTGHFNPDGVDLEISNEQLASLADVSPFTVSRLLSQWQREGALFKRRKALSIRSPEGLVDHQH